MILHIKKTIKLFHYHPYCITGVEINSHPAPRQLTTMPTPKRVAIIGAGCSGLTAIKCCLDEGLEPVCFERTDDLGGLWRYTEKAVEGKGSVMKSTVINASKEMMCFSDYPMAKETPNFLPHSLVWEYLKDYCRRFQLQRFIRYNMEVSMVTPASDFGSSGRWSLQLVNHKREKGNTSTEEFDAVLVCTGHHADKYEPSFPGLGNFQGQVIHSHEYRKPCGYDGKRVVVIGFGNSGGDVAVELSRIGQVYLSIRRGAWVTSRLGSHGMPEQLLQGRRISGITNSLLPPALVNWRLARRCNIRVGHDLYCLRPNKPPLDEQPTINDEIHNRIACGSITVKPNIKCFTATGVEFVDGSFADNIDVVVLATGYTFGFPFIDKSVVDVKDNTLLLYKYMFPPDLQHHTLAVIGCIQPRGTIIPISELQCRLATRVFKGYLNMPPPSAMWEDIRANEAAIARRYFSSPRHSLQVELIPFMDELADLIGCKPNIVAMWMRDPVLAMHVLFGPCTPSQYRLVGPGAWTGARETILTTMDRVRFPLATRPLLSPPMGRVTLHHSLGCAVGFALLMYLLRCCI